jgi:hypothetical protein
MLSYGHHDRDRYDIGICGSLLSIGMRVYSLLYDQDDRSISFNDCISHARESASMSLSCMLTVPHWDEMIER